MLVYKLKEKATEEDRANHWWTFIVKSTAEPECALKVDQSYTIYRYVVNNYMFYVHWVGVHLTKVCVYTLDVATK